MFQNNATSFLKRYEAAWVFSVFYVSQMFLDSDVADMFGVGFVEKTLLISEPALRGHSRVEELGSECLCVFVHVDHQDIFFLFFFLMSSICISIKF